MMSFRGDRLAGLSLPLGTVWLLTDVAEARGRQDLYTKQAPQSNVSGTGRASIASAISWTANR